MIRKDVLAASGSSDFVPILDRSVFCWDRTSNLFFDVDFARRKFGTGSEELLMTSTWTIPRDLKIS